MKQKTLAKRNSDGNYRYSDINFTDYNRFRGGWQSPAAAIFVANHIANMPPLQGEAG
ncbi:Uncharacterized protein dnm_099860 [Desulfonema magnum]|uniref:Uncharacterized protein n=1 Tax=Desulfonema magnum TaxID=45655 RepID=A0A975BY82_9BACT|nr:Uncharacterized protein dnm_099860 [Desulfonema magnum]